MAFPTIPGAGQIISVGNTTGGATKTFPNLSDLTKSAGDLLLAIIVEFDGNSTDAEFSNWGASFSEVADRAGTATMAIGVAYKTSTGSESGTFTVTTADTSANDSIMVLAAIPGASTTSAPAVSTLFTGTSADPDPPSLSPSWGAEDTLWIAVGANGETSTGGAYGGVTGIPTSYSGDYHHGITEDVVGGIDVRIGFRQLNASSENPGVFASDTTNTRSSAVLIAVRPKPLVYDDSGSGTVTLSGSGTDQYLPPTTLPNIAIQPYIPAGWQL